jgi:hypothetical protein
MDVFISYSRSSDAMAVELANELREKGLNVWIDHPEFHSGEAWPKRVSEAIGAADAFVVVVDEHTQTSSWARREMGEILKRTWDDESKVVVPVVIGDAELPGYLRDVNAVHIEGEGDSAAAIQTVSSRLTHDPGGVHRSAAGETRLNKRLADLEERAAKESADEEEA